MTSQLLDDVAEELNATHERLARAYADVQEVTSTAMDIALRLDASEKTLVETLEELRQVRDVELAEVLALSAERADTISRQADYITRLRTQVRHPLRILAKRVLSPVLKKRGDGHQ